MSIKFKYELEDFDENFVMSEKAEAALLGRILADDSIFPTIATKIMPAIFCCARNEEIYEKMLMLFVKGEPITPENIVAEDLAYLQYLKDKIPAEANAEYYIQIIREKALARRLMIRAEQIFSVDVPIQRKNED